MPFYRIQGSNKRIRIGKIICLVRTYKDHAYEMGSKPPEDPLFFIKPDTTIIFNGGTVKIPSSFSSCIHHEVELGVVLDSTASNVSTDEAKTHILGYLIGLDITARDIQDNLKKHGLPWGIAKSFDTFTPISDVVPNKRIINPNKIEIILKVNNVEKQRVNTSELLFPVEYIVSYLSRIMTLKRGDLILTGTPKGVGEIHKGDILEANLDRYCSLKVDVK